MDMIKLLLQLDNFRIACCDQMPGLSFIAALYQKLTLADDRWKAIGGDCEETASAINNPLQYVGLPKA